MLFGFVPPTGQSSDVGLLLILFSQTSARRKIYELSRLRVNQMKTLPILYRTGTTDQLNLIQQAFANVIAFWLSVLGSARRGDIHL
jgi:hypothetical protein